MTIIKLGDLVEVLESNDPDLMDKHLVLDKIDEGLLDMPSGPFFVDKDPDRHDDDEGGHETTFTNYGWAVRIRLVQEGATHRVRYDHPTRYFPNRVEVDGDGKFVRAWQSTDEPAAQDAVAVDDEGDDEASETLDQTVGALPERFPVGSRVVIKRAVHAEDTHGDIGTVEDNDTGMVFRTWGTREEVPHPYKLRHDKTGNCVWAAEVELAHEEDDETSAPELLPIGAHVVIKRATWAEESEGHTGIIERNDAPAEFTDVDDVTRSHPYRIKEDNTGRTIYAAEVELVDSAPESNDPAEAPKPVLTDPEDGQPVKTLGDFIRAMLSGGVDVEPPQIVSMGIITPDGKMQEMTPEELAARGVFVHGPNCGCEDPGALPDGELDLGQKLAALADEAEASRHDPVNHPSHYTSMPTGVECIDVIEWMNLCRGNAIKYIWRAGQKDPSKEIEDLEKAVWYLNREIDRLRRVQA